MKTETVEIVSPEEVRKELVRLVGEQGNQRAVSRVMGVRAPTMSNFLAGQIALPHDIAEALGFEIRRVAVKK